MSRAREYFGKYRLVRLIRAGHTCTVWEAVNEDEDARVALKIIKEEERENKLEIATLKHEYEICKDMKHPNIIRMYEFSNERGLPFLAMELFNAVNLKIMLRQGAERLFPIVKDIVEQSAEALYYFHQAGFIHRDIKPDNFLVSEMGVVKLIDFAISMKTPTGINKMLGGWMTKVQGTRSYMSPEQIKNQGIDHRADIYSFGCVLFELMAGKPPFTGDSATHLLSKHITASVPSPQVHCPNISPEFSDLIRSMMSKDRNQRPANMWEFLKRFRAIRHFKVLPKPKVADDEAKPEKK